MLLNSDFEDGYYPLVDERWPAGHDLRGPLPNLNIPKRWKFWYALNGDEPKSPFYHNDGEPKLVLQDQPWGRPEVVTWKNDNFGDEFQHAFAWRDGDYTLKVFGAFVPVWWRLYQNVGLEVGRAYTLKVPVYLELISSYNPTVVAGDPNSAQVRLYADILATTTHKGFATNTQFVHPNFMQWNMMEHSFIASSSTMRIGIEVQCRWGLVSNNVYLDGLTLETSGRPNDHAGKNEVDNLLNKIESSTRRIRELL